MLKAGRRFRGDGVGRGWLQPGGTGMDIEQSRAKITGRIWQAVGQSGVDVSAIPRDQQERLVGAIADSMLVTLDELMGDEDEAPAAEAGASATTSGGEQILWQGRPFLSIFHHYTVTNQRLRIRRGLLSRDTDDFDLVRIQDVDLTQKMTERMVDVGDITIIGADKSDPIVVLQNVHNPERVHEIIRQAVMEARKRQGVRYRDVLDQDI
jgi:hypothetical protein